MSCARAEVRASLQAALVATAQRLQLHIVRGIEQGALQCERADAAGSALLATIQELLVLAGGRDSSPNRYFASLSRPRGKRGHVELRPLSDQHA